MRGYIKHILQWMGRFCFALATEWSVLQILQNLIGIWSALTTAFYFPSGSQSVHMSNAPNLCWLMITVSVYRSASLSQGDSSCPVGTPY